jgi:hypothetical protein
MSRTRPASARHAARSLLAWRMRVAPYVAVALIAAACLAIAKGPSLWSGAAARQAAGIARTATIQLAPIDLEYCQRVEFDNDSGTLRKKGLQPCEVVGRKALDGTMAQLRESFNR